VTKELISRLLVVTDRGTITSPDISNFYSIKLFNVLSTEQLRVCYMGSSQWYLPRDIPYGKTPFRSIIFK
jgi:hypothetical protein